MALVVLVPWVALVLFETEVLLVELVRVPLVVALDVWLVATVPLMVVFAGMLLAGCAYHPPVQAVKAAPETTIVTPGDSLAGKVAACNAAGRFVVLNYPTAQMPPADQILFLYRAGLKVAEIRITGPQIDDNTVADIVSGEAQVGDEVREQ